LLTGLSVLRKLWQNFISIQRTQHFFRIDIFLCFWANSFKSLFFRTETEFIGT
jgi:hypothetical protein